MTVATQPAVPSPGPPPHMDAPQTLAILTAHQNQRSENSRGLRPNGTKDWLLVATLEGEGYFTAQGHVTVITRGDLLLYAPDTPQDYGYLRDDGDWQNIWVHFRPRPHWLPWLAWPAVSQGLRLLQVGAGFDAIENDLHRMVATFHSAARLREDLALNALESALLRADSFNPEYRQAGLDPRIRHALDIVASDLGGPLRVARLSKSVGLSRSRFSVLFTEQTSLSPQAYIEQVRLTRAAQLLAMSSLPIGNVAEEVGFPNAYYFSTRFRLRFGVPPSTFRASLDPR